MTNPEFINILPFRSRLVPEHDPDQPELDVSLWRSPENICQFDESRCDETQGLYYGSVADPVTWFCPRHFYEMHFNPNAAYRLIDLSDEEYEQEKAMLATAIERATRATLPRSM